MLTAILLLIVIICLLYIYKSNNKYNTEKFENKQNDIKNQNANVLNNSSKKNENTINDNKEEYNVCHYLDGETKILMAGDQIVDTDIYKTIKRPWDKENIVKETPMGKISTYYFLDPSRQLKFDKKCCVAPAPGEKVDYIQGKYFGSNSNGESGCLCMTKDMAQSLGHRGGNA